MLSNVSSIQVPGFQSFVIEAFATNCCLYSVLDKSFEFRDANTVSPFSVHILGFRCLYVLDAPIGSMVYVPFGFLFFLFVLLSTIFVYFLQLIFFLFLFECICCDLF